MDITEIMSEFISTNIAVLLTKEDLKNIAILGDAFGCIVWDERIGGINSSFTENLLENRNAIYVISDSHHLFWTELNEVIGNKRIVNASDIINLLKASFNVEPEEIENILLPEFAHVAEWQTPET